MADPIRVLHFADVHIGVENYGRNDPRSGLSTRVRDFLQRMDEMVKYAGDHDVDLVVFAGDAFKTRTPTPTYFREFADRIMKLAALAPVVLLTGNHDLPQTELKASSVEVFDTLKVPGVWVAYPLRNGYEGRVVETKRGPVFIGAAPFPMRAHLLTDDDSKGAVSIAETNALIEQRMAQYFAALAEDAAAHDMPRLLTGHFTVSGATIHRGSEQSMMLGPDIPVLVSTLCPPGVWDYVAMGHIHKHQNVTEGRANLPPIVYPGSLERIDFGEERDPKGFVWAEVRRGKAKWQFVPVDARAFVTLKADLRESEDPTVDALALLDTRIIENAIVRMILELSPETAARLNEKEIRDALHDADVHLIAGIQKNVEQPARTRLGSSPEGLTDLELLERYLKAKEVREERREQLLEAAKPILDDAARLDTPAIS
jgi:exonuclease SbcD